MVLAPVQGLSTPVLRASAASRWVFCPEAAWLEQLYPEIEGDAAREGTAAHEMAELVLTGTVSTPEELTDRPASNGVMMTGDMLPHVQMYIDHIRSRGVAWWVEESIEIKVRDGIVTGRCDGAAFSFDEHTGMLYIDDFKYGYGPVEIFENWQQLIYAIGMYLKIGAKITHITMTIIQPRGYHHDGSIRSWTIDCNTQLQGYMHLLNDAVEAVKSLDRHCHSGPWCRYCKVLSTCPTAKAAAMNAVDVVMKALPDTDTPEQIALLMDVLTRASKTIEHTLDAINARGEALILSGQPIPGYAFVPGTGRSKFINNEQAIATAAAFGIDITDIKVCTPAEAKRRGLPDTVKKLLAITPSTAPRLVKRDASTLADKVFK